MRLMTVEGWGCGECSAEETQGDPAALCDGCAKALCIACIEVATACAHCEVLVCRHCALRLFSLDCDGCGFALHYACEAKGCGTCAA